jgi:hypothetical protein
VDRQMAQNSGYAGQPRKVDGVDPPQPPRPVQTSTGARAAEAAASPLHALKDAHDHSWY